MRNDSLERELQEIVDFVSHYGLDWSVLRGYERAKGELQLKVEVKCLLFGMRLVSRGDIDKWTIRMSGASAKIAKTWEAALYRGLTSMVAHDGLTWQQRDPLRVAALLALLKQPIPE